MGWYLLFLTGVGELSGKSQKHPYVVSIKMVPNSSHGFNLEFFFDSFCSRSWTKRIFTWVLSATQSSRILCNIPYARHYNPRFVYFLPTLRRPFLCFQGRFLEKFCMVSIQERVMMARVRYNNVPKVCWLRSLLYWVFNLETFIQPEVSDTYQRKANHCIF